MRARNDLMETASQTAGPYVHIGCIPSFAGINNVYDADLGARPVLAGAAGARITIEGAIYDGAGAHVRDAMIESWQADAAGLYAGQIGADPNVLGFCRFAVDADSGLFQLETIKPGRVSGRDGADLAPHISLWIVARGINVGLHTRMYFDDEDNAGDALLAQVAPLRRADSLIAQKSGDGQYRFDIHLQGDQETVFLDI